MRTGSLIPNSCAIVSLAGAIIDEEAGLMKLKAETTKVVAHFLWGDQLSHEANEHCRSLADSKEEEI
jgi:hypothetical protein